MSAYEMAYASTLRKAIEARRTGRPLGVTRLELAALKINPKQSRWGFLLHGEPFMVVDQSPPCPCCGYAWDSGTGEPAGSGGHV